jgi:Protein of unknown function (DUF4238)
MPDQEQHFIPQFYLRAFRDPNVPEDKGPWLSMADFEQKTVQLRSPKAVGKKSNYYTFPEAETAIGESVESILAKVESVAAPVTQRLIASADMALEKQDRADLLFFMALFAVRVPTFRGSLAKDAPDPRSVQLPSQGRVVEVPSVGGLHHEYQRRAA